MTLYDHILGGLYGQALGDAWCMAALLTPEQTWQRHGGWIDRFLPGPDDFAVHAGLPPGRITDDTEQAFALADSILEDGGVTIEGGAVPKLTSRAVRRATGRGSLRRCIRCLPPPACRRRAGSPARLAV